MFEGMDFGMFGIDPRQLQANVDRQKFWDTANEYRMNAGMNSAATGAGLAMAAGQLIGNSLNRMHGIKDPEVEQVEKAQQVSDLLKNIEGDTPADYYANAAKAVQSISPQLAAVMGLKARQAKWEQDRALASEAADMLRARASMVGASSTGSSGGTEFFSTTSGQVSTTQGTIFGHELREKNTGKSYYVTSDGQRIDPSTIIGFTPSSGAAATNRAIADTQASPYAQGVGTLGDNSKSAINRAWEIAKENGEITEEEYEEPLNWYGHDYDKMAAKLQQIRERKQSWGNMAPPQEAFRQGVPRKKSGNYIDLMGP